MKKIMIVLLAFFLCCSFYGCKKENNNNNNMTSLQGTKWKLIGFVDAETDKLTVAEPKNCDQCYILEFTTDTTLFTHSSTNELTGNYTVNYTESTIQINNIGGTKINELFDGRLYIESLYKAHSFSIIENRLRLYYNDKTNYLLFKTEK